MIKLCLHCVPFNIWNVSLTLEVAFEPVWNNTCWTHQQTCRCVLPATLAASGLSLNTVMCVCVNYEWCCQLFPDLLSSTVSNQPNLTEAGRRQWKHYLWLWVCSVSASAAAPRPNTVDLATTGDNCSASTPHQELNKPYKTKKNGGTHIWNLYIYVLSIYI